MMTEEKKEEEGEKRWVGWMVLDPAICVKRNKDPCLRGRGRALTNVAGRRWSSLTRQDKVVMFFVWRCTLQTARLFQDTSPSYHLYTRLVFFLLLSSHQLTFPDSTAFFSAFIPASSIFHGLLFHPTSATHPLPAWPPATSPLSSQPDPSARKPHGPCT